MQINNTQFCCWISWISNPSIDQIVAVIICTTGIALLAYMDNSRTLGSVLIVAGSALCSAVYKVSQPSEYCLFKIDFLLR